MFDSKMPAYLIRSTPNTPMNPRTNEYHLTGHLVLTDQHPCIHLVAQNRAMTALIGGQVLCNILANTTWITREQMAVPFNGQVLNDHETTRDLTDNQKKMLLMIAGDLVSIASTYVEKMNGHLIPLINQEVGLALRDGKFPEDNPLRTLMYRVEETFVFNGVSMLFRPIGGVFSAISGLAFHYCDVDTGNTVDYLLEMGSIDSNIAAEVSTTVKALLDYRAKVTDGITTADLEGSIAELVQRYTDVGFDLTKPAEGQGDVNAAATNDDNSGDTAYPDGNNDSDRASDETISEQPFIPMQ